MDVQRARELIHTPGWIVNAFACLSVPEGVFKDNPRIAG